jgi:hypothetical protein
MTIPNIKKPSVCVYACVYVCVCVHLFVGQQQVEFALLQTGGFLVDAECITEHSYRFQQFSRGSI